MRKLNTIWADSSGLTQFLYSHITFSTTSFWSSDSWKCIASDNIRDSLLTQLRTCSLPISTTMKTSRNGLTHSAWSSFCFCSLTFWHACGCWSDLRAITTGMKDGFTRELKLNLYKPKSWVFMHPRSTGLSHLSHPLAMEKSFLKLKLRFSLLWWLRCLALVSLGIWLVLFNLCLLVWAKQINYPSKQRQLHFGL